MEPFDSDELSDVEMDRLLKKWEAPEAPVRLRAAIFGDAAHPWWRRIWTASFRVPMPVAAAFAIALALGAWQWHKPGAAREVVKTERVEAPVWKDRVIVKTVYRDRFVREPQALRPVAELRPRIVRAPDEQ
jgi:hypothetical protein